MSVVQTDYPRTHDAYIPGQVATTQTCDFISRQLEGDNVPFGYAVQPGSDEDKSTLGADRVKIGQLSAALNNSDTDGTIDAMLDARWDARYVYVVIDSEIIRIALQPTEAGSGAAREATFANNGLIRGQLGSSAAAHSDNADVFLLDSCLFDGIAVMDERLKARADVTDAYAEGDPLSIMNRGDIATKVSAAVAAGNQVVVTTETATGDPAGSLSSRPVDATHVAVPNARFVTAAADDGIAVVRLGGIVPPVT